MRIVVNGPAGTVTAEDANDLNALSVALVEIEPATAATMLREYGRLDGAHVWLDVAALRSFAPQPRPCSWDERFAKTLEYAASMGWLDESGTAVRAHIEPSDAQTPAR